MTKPAVLRSPLLAAVARPNRKPNNPHFSSGPCAKRPGWSLAALSQALTGRSHRSKAGKARLIEVIERTRLVLGIPADYRIAIVPASDTGAFEMAMWTLLGQRGVELLAWESFGLGWVTDVVKQLKLGDVRQFVAPYGRLPDLRQIDSTRDVVFAWNGTTSGVCVPDGDWISAERQGLTLCDATSAAFAMDLPWHKLDVATYSWQKVLGGEAQHGMLVLSPRAVARLESHAPPWPLPKLFRLTKGGKLQEAIFLGDTINTPSMLCVEDALDGLRWAESVGGRAGLAARTRANAAVIARWIARSDWAAYLAEEERYRSPTSVCLKIVDPWFQQLESKAQAAVAKAVASLLEEEGAAFDIGAHRDAPAGLRIWCGATVEANDVEALLPWLDWAYAHTKAGRSTA
ncbi:MAG: phosphoserine transaminase [Alphaproteobacteria bacterium]|nr:phosphoserine transaminase [Alphaproteobacteria bacterium]